MMIKCSFLFKLISSLCVNKWDTYPLCYDHKPTDNTTFQHFGPSFRVIFIIKKEKVLLVTLRDAVIVPDLRLNVGLYLT